MSRRTATYTLTKPTDKLGKLFRIVRIGSESADITDDPRMPVKPTETPGVWITEHHNRVQVWLGSLVVFVGDVERSFSQIYCDVMGIKRVVNPGWYLLLHCPTSRLIAVHNRVFALQEVRDEGE
ncbi:MAG: hypothetical protein E6R04_08810 [Spirochaetes bacterium]|jgi:hypothetical protein|nr:MAG: hypothetical protein E6R04_08810 [Spirochaetota bacterium]